MYIVKELNGKITQRTSDYITALIILAKSESAELYEKVDSKPAKQIGYTTKEYE